MFETVQKIDIWGYVLISRISAVDGHDSVIWRFYIWMTYSSPKNTRTNKSNVGKMILKKDLNQVNIKECRKWKWNILEADSFSVSEYHII